MSIADAINNARQKINNVYNALGAKGATLPGTMNLDHMVTTVEAIPEFHQTASLMNGWNATINESGFILAGPSDTSELNNISVIVPDVSNISGVYLKEDLFNSSSGTYRLLETASLSNIPFVNNSMVNTFRNCGDLVSVVGINSNIVNMAYAFSSCSYFNQNIQIPNSVTNMAYTFSGCSYFNQNIQIPSSVTNMANTFQACYNFNQPIQIPNSVTSMVNTFSHCEKFNQPIQIPNSVTNMYGTFIECRGLNQPIQIPNSVVDMRNTFEKCTHLNCDISIGSSVVDMSSAFDWCAGLRGKNITIFSPEVANLTRTFDAFGTASVYIPFNYSNNVRTTTFNSFVSAGFLYANGVSNNTTVVVKDLATLNT